jgi:hypothetical protein
MPKLPTYDAPLGGLPGIGGRRANADDFGGGVAQAIGQVGGALKQVNNDIEESESRDALVKSTEIRAKYAKRLDEAATSGSDLAALQEEMNDELSKVGENFATRKGQSSLQMYSANTNLMFDEQSNNIAVTRAGAQAKLAASKFRDSATRLLQMDPSSLASQESLVDDFVSTFGRIPVENRALIADELKNELNMAAAMRTAQLFPEEIDRRVNAGEWKLTAAQQRSVLTEAEQEITSRRIAAEHNRQAQEREKKERIAETNDALFGQFVQGNLKIETVRESGLPAFGDGSQKQWFDMLKQQAEDWSGKPAKTDPALFNTVRQRIDLPPGHPEKINEPSTVLDMYGRGLALDDAKWLATRITENKSEGGQTEAAAVSEVISNLRGQLDKSNMLSIDQGGGERVQAFTIHLRDKISQYKKDGRDPYLLLRPNAPDYIGNDLPLFLSGAQRMQQDLTKQLDEALTPKEPAQRRSLDDIFKGAPVEVRPSKSATEPIDSDTPLDAPQPSVAQQYLNAIDEWEKTTIGTEEYKAAKKKVDALEARRLKGEK